MRAISDSTASLARKTFKSFFGPFLSHTSPKHQKSHRATKVSKMPGRQGSIASLGAVSAASLPAQPVASVPSGSVREVSVEEASLGPVAGGCGWG